MHLLVWLVLHVPVLVVRRVRRALGGNRVAAALRDVAVDAATLAAALLVVAPLALLLALVFARRRVRRAVLETRRVYAP